MLFAIVTFIVYFEKNLYHSKQMSNIFLINIGSNEGFFSIDSIHCTKQGNLIIKVYVQDSLHDFVSRQQKFIQRANVNHKNVILIFL